MSRYNHNHNLSGKDYFFRVLFSVIATAILVASMPHGGMTSAYHYQKGEPWENEAFIAQDSFPILKPADRIAREQDSLRQFYEPYFRLDEETEEQQMQALRQEFVALSRLGTPHYFLPHLLEKLRHIYSTGILSGEDAARFDGDTPQRVRIYHGIESAVRNYSSLFSEKTAYEYLMAEEDSVRFGHSRLHGLDLMRFVHPNLTYDAAKSEQQRQEVDGRLVRTMGVVLQGQKVVDKGQIVDDGVMDILQSWELHQREHKLSTSEVLSRLGGRTVYIAILVVLLLMYFPQFRSDYLDSFRTVLLILSLFLVFPVITYAIMGHMWASVYVVPYCMLPILLRIFLDSRSAFITHVITILASAVVLTQPFTFIVTQIVAGLVAIYSLRELSQRYELFRATVWVTISTLLTYLCMEFVRGSADGSQELSRWPYIYLTVAGVLTMLVYLLLIPIERIFGFTSIVTLVELQNVNNPLLRRLSEEATGTFNHSMQVANLAAAVANKIGAKAQRVRRTLPRHRKAGERRLLHREPERTEPPRRAALRAQRTDHHPTRGEGPAAGRQVQTARRREGLHRHAPRAQPDPLLLRQGQGESARRDQSRCGSLHLSRAQAADAGAGHPDDGRCRGGRIAQPARVHRGEHQPDGGEDYRGAGERWQLQRVRHHLPRDKGSEGGALCTAPHRLPHPHTVPRVTARSSGIRA